MNSLNKKTRNKYRLILSILLLMNMIACSILSGEKPPVDNPQIEPLQRSPVMDDQNWRALQWLYLEECREAIT